MSTPANVNWKLARIALGVCLIALIGSEKPKASEAAQSKAVKSSQSDGTYLYGETPQPNRIRQGYVVFSKQNGRVVGALYSPRSEFECFVGSVNNNTLNVSTVTSEDSQPTAMKVNLAGLHRIGKISAEEKHMISVCKEQNVALVDK